MMKRKSILAELIIIFALFISSMPLNADTSRPPWLHTDGNQIKGPDGNVVVLRGVDLIDLGFLEKWQGGAIAMIDRLTDINDNQGESPGWYTKVIRIRITPADAKPNWPYRFYPNDPNFYEKLLRPVVDYIGEKDMYAIIDWHYIDDTYKHIDTTSAFWTYMAPRFAKDSHVLFELFNEPINNTFNSDDDDWNSVRKDMQAWIDIVRRYAPDNLILVAGPSWSQVIGPAAKYPLNGNNIVIVSHIYPGHWLKNPAGNNTYTSQIDTCLTVYPVFMSEWGFSMTTTTDDLLKGTITNYGQPLSDFREARKISNSAWVASHNWQPPMFNKDWTLRVGDGEMGGFTKDTLYNYRNNDLPNHPPSVSITSPANGVRFTAPATIIINATASDTDGTISSVAFYMGSNLLRTDITLPYSDTWSNVPAGIYSVTASATDDDGATTTSSAVNITVVAGGLRLLNDGFERNFNWWTDGGTTDWDRATSQKFSGSYSAHAGSSDNDLISDNLNTSGKTSITIDFWFRDNGIDDDDDIYLQLYNGSSYTNFYELGKSPENTWNHYTVRIRSSQYPQYFRTNFRIKFEGSSIDSRENLWIDSVIVTAQ